MAFIYRYVKRFIELFNFNVNSNVFNSATFPRVIFDPIAKYGIIIDIFNFSFQFYVLSFLKLYFMKINRIMKREILSKKNFFIILSIILDMCFFNVFKIIIFIMIREF